MRGIFRRRRASRMVRARPLNFQGFRRNIFASRRSGIIRETYGKQAYCAKLFSLRSMVIHDQSLLSAHQVLEATLKPVSREPHWRHSREPHEAVNIAEDGDSFFSGSCPRAPSDIEFTHHSFRPHHPHLTPEPQYRRLRCRLMSNLAVSATAITAITPAWTGSLTTKSATSGTLPAMFR